MGAFPVSLSTSYFTPSLVCASMTRFMLVPVQT
jgi:hypothetical protein